MKMRTLLFALMISLLTISLFAADGVNFTGTWTLDQSKVQTHGDQPSMAAGKIVVIQDGNSLKTERFLSNPMMGDFTIKVDLTLDGKENKSTEEFGTRLSTATWSKDNKVLTINSTMQMNFDGQNMEMKSTEMWSLEKDNVLKLETSFDGPMGAMEDVNFYNKAE